MWKRAQAMESTLHACENPRTAIASLRAFDADFKAPVLHPGICADQTVTWAAVRLLQTRAV